MQYKITKKSLWRPSLRTKNQGCEVVLVQQTCIEKNEDTAKYSLPNFLTHFVNVGNGKGLALYYTEKFSVSTVFATEQYQIAKIESDEFDIISVYRSSDSNHSKQYDFSKQVLSMVNEYKKTLILGDFNCSALVNADNAIVRSIENSGFIQAVQKPTHIQGGLIDHIYVSHHIATELLQVTQKAVYYTDVMELSIAGENSVWLVSKNVTTCWYICIYVSVINLINTFHL